MTMTIGEASAKSGVPAKTIRYYEESGLIGRAGRRPNLYRTYGEEDVAMLRFIGRARRLGFSIEDVKSLIALYRDRSRSSSDVKALATQHLARVERKIRELRSVRDALAHLIDQCSGDHRPDCPIIDDLSGEEGSQDPASLRARPTARRARSRSGAEYSSIDRHLAGAVS
jgi:MerR family copper efflux transcriptional regulator